MPKLPSRSSIQTGIAAGLPFSNERESHDGENHELAEARAWIENDEPLMNAGKPLARGRVGRLVDILATIKEEEEGKEVAGQG